MNIFSSIPQHQPYLLKSNFSKNIPVFIFFCFTKEKHRTKCENAENKRKKNSQTFLIDQANEEERDSDLSDNEKHERKLYKFFSSSHCHVLVFGLFCVFLCLCVLWQFFLLALHLCLLYILFLETLFVSRTHPEQESKFN